MDATTRLALPLLHAGQAAKELTHNEALLALDIIAVAAVETSPQNEPPGSPSVGECFLVGTSPTGDWTGRSEHLASWTTGGWRFVVPVEGMTAFVKDSALTATFIGGEWAIGTVRAAAIEVGSQQVVGAQGSAIPDPNGGAQVDAEARTAIGAILTALRQHGLIAT